MDFRRILLGGLDRSAGEEIALAGDALLVRLPPSAPSRLSVSFSGPKGARVPLVDGLYKIAYATLWLYHDTADVQAGALELTVLRGCEAILPAEPDPRADLTVSLGGKTGSFTLLAALPGLAIRVHGFRLSISADATLAAADVLTAELGYSTTNPLTVHTIPGTETQWYLPDTTPTGAIGAYETGWQPVPGRGFLLPRDIALVVRTSGDLASGELLAQAAYSLEP